MIWIGLIALPVLPITVGERMLVDSAGVLLITGAPADATLMLTTLLYVPVLVVACKVALKLPLTVAVPVIWPVTVLKPRPAGKAPAVWA